MDFDNELDKLKTRVIYSKQDESYKDDNSYSETIFESIKHIDENGIEYWYARELSRVLEYKDYRNFLVAIYKAMEACQNSGNDVLHHIGETTNMITVGKGAQRKIDDYKLSRYGCYLIIQNANPDKEIVALGQTYFAIQTRRQEIQDFESLNEDGRRIELRNTVKGFNKKLADTAQNAGVNNFGKFQNSGYKGLYNGETASDIKSRKKLKKSHDILDYMGATELAANYFRITQTEEKIRSEIIQGEENACDTHFEVGMKVRKTMIDISGKAPEELPTPTKGVQQLEKEIFKNKLK
jgi:DNA-damage-inducible protein D